MASLSEELKDAEACQLENVKVDPWFNRPIEMKCEKCMWYVKKVSEAATNRQIGRCRRHAPTMTGYPVVFVNDWCGDHKLDETKRRNKTWLQAM